MHVETVGNQNVCAISIELFTARSLLHVLSCNYSTVQTLVPPSLPSPPHPPISTK